MSTKTTERHECYTRGPRELFITSGFEYGEGRPAPHYGLSGLVSMLSNSSLKLGGMSYLEEVMNDAMLSTFAPLDTAGYTSELIPNRTLSPLLYTCGDSIWLGGHCTGSLFIYPLCVNCAQREGVLPKAKLDEIVVQAEGERKEAELLVKSGVSANISSAYEYMLNSVCDVHKRYEKIVSHFETQLAYVLESNNDKELHTPDENGRLLLHRALHDRKVSFYTIDLIAKKNGAAVQVADNDGLLPLHIACMVSVGRATDYEHWEGWQLDDDSDSESESDSKVIRRVFNLERSLLDKIDKDGCNALHHACRSGILGAVEYLIGHSPPLAYVRNKNNLLPIHLLCDKSGKDDIIEKVQYIETVWQLLMTYPESVSVTVGDWE